MAVVRVSTEYLARTQVRAKTHHFAAIVFRLFRCCTSNEGGYEMLDRKVVK